ncbi:hypothetical protein KR093_010725 [Drosophila rubida]|uniref:Uncharacterized protein n=1 Tax=Drosophila rubida TaxID=30044 RepID=A0AAD4JRQ1_9MUSC|nr:hypothetical protein KR093_010725 [Drosophila rubida]
MKVVLLIFIVCSLYEFVLGAINMETYRSKQQECFKELKIPQAEAEHVSKDKLVSVPSEPFKCFHNCLYTKLGLFAKDKINVAAVIPFAHMRFSKVPVDAIKKKLKICNETSPITCEVVFDYETCLGISLHK